VFSVWVATLSSSDSCGLDAWHRATLQSGEVYCVCARNEPEHQYVRIFIHRGDMPELLRKHSEEVVMDT
jgi:hypothetical protein